MNQLCARSVMYTDHEVDWYNVYMMVAVSWGKCRSDHTDHPPYTLHCQPDQLKTYRHTYLATVIYLNYNHY